VTDGLSPLFGQPEYTSNLACAPRTLQVGFRLTFRPRDGTVVLSVAAPRAAGAVRRHPWPVGDMITLRLTDR
jgi:hypothetical protein